MTHLNQSTITVHQDRFPEPHPGLALRAARLMPPLQRSLRAAAMALGAVALVAVTGATASADPATIEHWNLDTTLVHPAGSDDWCNLPFDVVERDQMLHNFVGVLRGPDGTFYGAEKYNGTTTYSNPANGRNYVDQFAGSNRDQLNVDNGDGTTTQQVQLTGPNRWYANGTLMFVDTGMVRFTLLFHDGVDEPDFVSLDQVTGLRQTNGRDFCADLAQFLG